MPINLKDWEKAQKWEFKWHDNCVNSINEELKQIVYADRMGLTLSATAKTPYNYDLKGISVLDIGGGAYSLLLKCVNFSNAVVIDPLMNKYPLWVINRYSTIGILPIMSTGEDIIKSPLGVRDEVWIYNVLQHTINPQKIIKNAKKLGKVIRIFEWIDTPTNIGHPHSLKESLLNKWLGGEGKIEFVNQMGAVGKCYYGIFKGDNYAK